MRKISHNGRKFSQWKKILSVKEKDKIYAIDLLPLSSQADFISLKLFFKYFWHIMLNFVNEDIASQVYRFVDVYLRV